MYTVFCCMAYNSIFCFNYFLLLNINMHIYLCGMCITKMRGRMEAGWLSGQRDVGCNRMLFCVYTSAVYALCLPHYLVRQ